MSKILIASLGYSSLVFTSRCIQKFDSLFSFLKFREEPDKKRVFDLLGKSCQEMIDNREPGKEPTESEKEALIEGLNGLLDNRKFYDKEIFSDEKLSENIRNLSQKMEYLSGNEVKRFNRALIESVFPFDINKSRSYSKANYLYHDKLKRNAFLPSELLIQIIQPDRLYFVGTDKSAWDLADERIGVGKYQRVEVPYGIREEDWWQMLRNLTDISIKEGDEIYLDITLGFRSLPLFSMLALIYFEKIHNAKTMGVFYGMWEYPQSKIFEGEEIKTTPVVDLSPVLKIKDWIEGYSLFRNFGDASMISGLVMKKPEAEDFSEKLSHISNAMGLNYIKDICRLSEELKQLKNSVKQAIDKNYPPASLITDELFDVLGEFSGKEGETYSQIHFRISQWYREHRRYTQCIILLAEIMLTFLVENIDSNRVLDRNFRIKIGDNIINDTNTKEVFPEMKKFIKFAKKLGQLRNQSAHADMRESSGLKPGVAPEKMLKYSKETAKFINDHQLAKFIQDNSENIMDYIETKKIVIDVEELYKEDGTALTSKINDYLKKLDSMYDFNGRTVLLTGRGPIWLYLKIAHYLHGYVRELLYESPVTGKIVIFDHSS